MSDDLAKLASVLAPALAEAMAGQSAPRPDPRDQERRLGALETSVEKLVGAVDNLVELETKRAAVTDHWKWLFSNWPALGALGGVGYMLVQGGGLG